jgi:Fic family protein
MTDFFPNLPYNNLPKLPPNELFEDPVILKKVNKANKAVSELNGLIRSLEKPEIILEPLKVKEAVESSGIENINTTISEALQAELFSSEKLSQEQKETKNYKKALLLGHNNMVARKILSITDFIAIQTELGIQHPGIRNLSGTKIGNRTTGEVFYTPPEGEDLIRELLHNYELYYNDDESDPDYLIKMAILHYQFEAIHPFFDGNGRTGRILMVLYLTLHDCLSSPTLFISQYINQNRSEYYRLLREVTSKNNWKEWILYILDAAETQANKTNSTILEILDLRKNFKEVILPKYKFAYNQELLGYIFSNAFYTQSKLMEFTSIKSQKTAIDYLNTLVKEGVLKVAPSKTKEKVYYFESFLKLLE